MAAIPKRRHPGGAGIIPEAVVREIARLHLRGFSDQEVARATGLGAAHRARDVRHTERFKRLLGEVRAELTGAAPQAQEEQPPQQQPAPAITREDAEGLRDAVALARTTLEKLLRSECALQEARDPSAMKLADFVRLVREAEQALLQALPTLPKAAQEEEQSPALQALRKALEARTLEAILCWNSPLGAQHVAPPLTAAEVALVRVFHPALHERLSKSAARENVKLHEMPFSVRLAPGPSFLAGVAGSEIKFVVGMAEDEDEFAELVRKEMEKC